MLQLMFLNKILSKIQRSVLKRFYILFNLHKKSIIFKNDILLDLDLREKIDRFIYFNKTYEDELLNKSLSLIKNNNIKYFFDIGCNFGIYSLYLGKNFKNLEIFAFDILENNILRMNEMIKKNNLINISTYPYGLSNKNEELVAYSDSNNSSVYRLQKLSNLNYRVEKKVKVKRLDDLFPNIKDVKIFIKIDIENHETYFIEGARNFLKNNKVIIQIETNDEIAKDIELLLEKLDYKIFNQTDWKWDRYYSNFETKNE